jgi:hypothetical protein
MGDVMYLYNYLMEALFIGFGIVTILLLLPYRFLGKELQLHVDRCIKSITKMMPFVALVYLMVAGGFIIQDAISLNNGNGSLERMKGPYGGAYVFKVFLIPMTLLLLWMNRVSSRKLWIFLLAIVVGFSFIIMNERFVIFITSIHRDFLPPYSKGYDYDIFFFFGRFLLEQIVIFCVLFIPIHFFTIQNKATENN